jgi:hypothetical protein
VGAGLFEPKIEAEKDETLTQYLQKLVRRHQSSLLDLRHPNFYKNHEIRATLLFSKSGTSIGYMGTSTNYVTL